MANTKKPALDPITEATSQLVQPVYQSGVKPLVEEIGKAGKTVGQLVNFALAPFALSVFAYQQAEPRIKKKIEQKISGTPKEKLIHPKARVAIPALQSFVHASDEEDEEIADMFANLLASAMNVDKATNVHPSFVEVINSITSDEARVLRMFAQHDSFPVLDVHLNKPEGGYTIVLRNFSLISNLAECVRGDLVPTYLDNLCRLGILEIPSGITFHDAKIYEEIDNHPEIIRLKSQLETEQGYNTELAHKIVKLTSFGRLFVNVCISVSSAESENKKR